jgi:hypothetical protein
LASLIEVFRALDILDRFTSLFPPSELSLLELLKLQGKRRKRASKTQEQDSIAESEW